MYDQRHKGIDDTLTTSARLAPASQDNAYCDFLVVLWEKWKMVVIYHLYYPVNPYTTVVGR